MAIMEISVSPRSKDDISISQYLVDALKVVKESGLRYELHAMGTNVEGEADELFALASKMHRAAFNNGVQRVATSLKIDERHDKQVDMESKINSVKERL